MNTQSKRRPWSGEDNKVLMGLWDTIGSVILIALMMDRSASSIQTQASRLGLPARAEEKDKHRRRWSDDDDGVLEVLTQEHTSADGQIDVKSIALGMGRSIDAVITRLEALQGENSGILDRILIPPHEVFAEDAPPLQFRTAKPGEKEKKCMRCRKMFWSEGSFNWVCVPCKRSEDWLSA